MTDEQRLNRVRDELTKLASAWAAGRDVDARRMADLRREAILINHAHYLQTIPVYRKLAREEGIEGPADIDTIKRKLMFSDGIFKSYRQDWLDANDFSSMNRWLSSIRHKPVEIDISGLASIDDWADRLGAVGIRLVYSSGTSGAFSFVPRDEDDWAMAKAANMSYLAPLLLSRLGNPSGPGLLSRVVSPTMLAKTVSMMGLPGFDAVLLGFRGGRMGNQALMQELAGLFRQRCYLYDFDITAAALRSLRCGPRTAQERQMVDSLIEETAGKRREANYLRVINSSRTSTGAGKKVFVFGAPFQFKELCEIAAASGLKPALKEGSLVLFGGGWKSFTGEAIERERLVGMVSETFRVSPQMVLEGYSMTEISVLMLRCSQGRFHIPPLIEPVILDEELNPVHGKDVTGTFGFLDSLATSYPGFVISGDLVRMVDGECGCGLTGPAITEIGRSQGQEVKGCGGIMGSIRA